MNPLISSEELKGKYIDFARKSDSKLSIILGAGASFGYSRNPNYIFTPPTVSTLLDSNNYLVKQILEKPEHTAVRGQRPHIQRSLRSLGNDLEAYLSDIYANDPADNLFPSMLRYLEDIFTFASLNVDLGDNYYQSLISRTRDLRGTRVNSSVPNFIEHRRTKDKGVSMIYNFPLMMIPIHTLVKSENSFFAKQIEDAKNEIAQSRLVIAIGYQFGDSTFLEALRSLNLKESILILVGSTHLRQEITESKAYKAASKAWPKENIRIYEEVGFGEFVDALY